MRSQDKLQAEDQDNSLSSPNAKADRLKRVRNLANLSREDFCADGTINLTTLISWEVGRFGGLSRKGAASVVARIAKEGVFVAPEWLLYGTGAGPEVHFNKMSAVHDELNHDVDTLSENAKIMIELSVFRKLHKNAIDFIVDDDTMLPHYQPGDYVAGVKRFGDDIKSLIGHTCIVQTASGSIYFRNLLQGPRENSYNLIPANPQANANNTVVYDVELECAATVVWNRRSEQINKEN
ncbi:MAG TPA: S24/S26 family peptidase [Gammaproteobacteria bacterium]|jgi:hypothetical protein|nr:S24/S26 family peptidase [Gammaproteobacteria bacterium]